jgi:soluble lytic murein transglycosylase-like protein
LICINEMPRLFPAARAKRAKVPISAVAICDGTALYRRGCVTKLPGLAAKYRHPRKPGDDMIRSLCIATSLIAFAAAVSPATAQTRRTAVLDANGNASSGGLDMLISKHAAANNVPEELVRRVIKRESGGNPRVVSKGNFGLMQIKLATARGLGYRGTAAGLLDPDTNMKYAVKYLAGAYRVAGGNHARAVSYYASGYYYAAKRKGLTAQASANPVDGFKSVFDGNGSTAAASEPEVTASVRDTPAASAARLREAKALGESVSSSSSLYSGRLDHY